MSNLINLLVYVLHEYPRPEELSNPRLINLIYLIDWKYAIDTGDQFTEVEWYYNHYGPFADEIYKVVISNPQIFKINKIITNTDTGPEKISLVSKERVSLPTEIKEIADFFINHTSKLTWSEFISLVYSSYPIKSNSQYTNLNLQEDSNRFKEYKEITN